MLRQSEAVVGVLVNILVTGSRQQEEPAGGRNPSQMLDANTIHSPPPNPAIPPSILPSIHLSTHQ